VATEKLPSALSEWHLNVSESLQAKDREMAHSTSGRFSNFDRHQGRTLAPSSLRLLQGAPKCTLHAVPRPPRCAVVHTLLVVPQNHAAIDRSRGQKSRRKQRPDSLDRRLTRRWLNLRARLSADAMRSGDDAVDHVAMQVGQPEVAA
jgi:hypothetical protein